jgi:hypothetical protein
MAYKYHMVQVPPTISVKSKEYKGGEAAGYLQDLVSQVAAQGWEFYRVDSIGVQVQPGCLASIFGASVQERTYYVVTFRAPA